VLAASEEDTQLYTSNASIIRKVATATMNGGEKKNPYPKDDEVSAQ